MTSRCVIISNGLDYTWAGDLYKLPSGKHDILKPGLLPKGVERVVAELLKGKYGVETPSAAQVRVEQEYVKEEAFAETAETPATEVPATAPAPPVVVAEAKPAKVRKPRKPTTEKKK